MPLPADAPAQPPTTGQNSQNHRSEAQDSTYKLRLRELENYDTPAATLAPKYTHQSP